MSAPEPCQTGREDRLDAVLGAYLEAQAAGRPPTLEDLCATHPDLAADLRDFFVDQERLKRVAAPFRLMPAEFRGTDQLSIVRPLGAGAMGTVFEAVDRRQGRRLALKLLRLATPASIIRFKQEFRRLANVSHPNVATLYELLSDGVSWFFTMELVDGCHFLEDVQAQGGGPGANYDRLRESLSQLATGVQALHAKNILHRDLKPSNVLVTHAGRVVLVDFGLATEFLEPAAAGYLIGTAAYMAPEQAALGSVGPASDWYGVGAVLYAALTGQPPFTGSPAEIIQAKQRLEPPPPCALVPGIPDDLNALCVDLLRLRPEVRPRAEEVFRLLGGRSATRVPIGAMPPRFVGRTEYLAQMTRAFEEVIHGCGMTVFIHGPSGVGKSTLLRRFLNGIRERDDEAVVLSSQCYERESIPYKAVDGLVDALAVHLRSLPAGECAELLPADLDLLSRMFPVLRQASSSGESQPAVDPNDARRRAFAALRELLGRIAQRRTLVLAIDDLQWGDLDSAALLASLIASSEPLPALLISCYRSEQRASNPFLIQLEAMQARLGRSVDLPVDPLAAEEAATLALGLLGPEVKADEATAIAAESGGIPFFIAELVRHRHGLAGQRRAIALSEVIWERIAQLPGPAQELLEVVAVADRPLGKASAFQAAALGGNSLDALILLQEGNLVRTAGPDSADQIATYHAHISKAILGHLSAARLAEHHGRLARVLEDDSTANPETLSIHWQGAGDRDRAAPYALQAAQNADRALAFDQAVRLYRRVLALVPITGNEERILRRKLGDALARAGRGSEAATEYLAAVGTDPFEALDLRSRAAMQLCNSGRFDRGLEILKDVLPAQGFRVPVTPRRAYWSVIAYRFFLLFRGYRFKLRPDNAINARVRLRLDTLRAAYFCFSTHDIIRAAVFSSRHLLLALQTGDRRHVALALLDEIPILMPEPSQRRLARRLLRIVSGLAEELADPHLLAYVVACQGFGEFMEGRWRTLVPLFDQVIANSSEDLVWFNIIRTALTAYVFIGLARQGQLRELARRREIAVAEAKELDNLWATTLYRITSNFLYLAANDVAGARQDVQETLAGWSVPGYHTQHWLGQCAQVQSDLYENTPGAPIRRIREQLPALKASGMLRLQLMRIDLYDLRGRAALAGAAAGIEPKVLLREAEADARRIERERMPWSNPLALVLRAGFAFLLGQRDTAATLLARAALGFDAAHMALHAAAARRQQGRLVGGDEGRRLIEAADIWMRSQNIRVPEKMTNMLVPGFGRA